MARKSRGDSSGHPSSSSWASTSSMPGASTNSRRRGSQRNQDQGTDSSSPRLPHGEPTPKVINAAPSLAKASMYGIDNERPASSRIMAMIGRVCMETIPQLVVVGAMLGLIFGGCCSNVFALEAIIKPNPDAGTLFTFVQFIFVAITSYVSQFDVTRPPFFLKPNRVPIRRWFVNIGLFFTINVMNNYAFSYNISVPIHIILRSGGSITTLAAGYLVGKRFTTLQVTSVLLLTIGVIIAAWSDATSKDKEMEETQGISTFGIGLIILFVSQILSAIMGLYTEETYREYGPQWKENLFYSHFLSLPLFIPFFPQIGRQFMRLARSEPLQLPFKSSLPLSTMSDGFQGGMTNIHIPSQIAYLVMNVLTQYACIRGVNLLAATASALTVTIVLNIRKLVSLLLSIWLFGNRLSPGTLLGAVIVFGAGGMYTLGGGKGIARPRRAMNGQNGVINSVKLEK